MPRRLSAPQARTTHELIKAQGHAGHNMRSLGERLRREMVSADTLDGNVRATFDGLQRLRQVHISPDALDATGGGRAQLADKLLDVLQMSFDSSNAASKSDVWALYRDNPELLQAPLMQIGEGVTAEDPWANVTRTDESVRLAEELFAHFDEDGDGHWNMRETSEVQKATEGTDMSDDAFNSLIIATADNKGRELTEEDLERGLSRDQVIELYTDAAKQRSLGFLLNIYKDHAEVFAVAGDRAE